MPQAPTRVPNTKPADPNFMNRVRSFVNNNVSKPAIKNKIAKRPSIMPAIKSTKPQNPSFIGGSKQFYGPPMGYKNK